MGAVIRAALVILTTIRLIRLIQEDHLGRWYVMEPAQKWAIAAELEAAGAEPYDKDARPLTWQMGLYEGLNCRWCVGFWVGVLVLAGEVIATRIPGIRHLWRFATLALALNAAAVPVARWLKVLS